MLFVPSVWQDIRKYYENSYVKFLEYGEELFFITRVRENGILGTDASGAEFSLSLDEDAPYHLTYNLPHKGLFQMDNSTYLLHRVPAQQYSRGITNNNTKIVEVASGKAITLNFQRLKAFVEKQPYVSMNSALFTKLGVCVPLTNRFSFYSPKQTFYVDTHPIAVFDRTNRTVVTTNTAGRALIPELKALADTHPSTANLLFK